MQKKDCAKPFAPLPLASSRYPMENTSGDLRAAAKRIGAWRKGRSGTRGTEALAYGTAPLSPSLATAQTLRSLSGSVLEKGISADALAAGDHAPEKGSYEL